MRTLSESRIQRERQRQDEPHWLEQVTLGVSVTAALITFCYWALSAPGV